MRRGKAVLSLVLALVFTAGVFYLGAFGAGPLPPLGPAFNPGTGIYTMAAAARLPASETLQAPGLQHAVTVSFTPSGAAVIDAQDAHDLFFAEGYLQARFRLFQMDLMRREGEGLLSQVIGPAGLSSDRFELELGILRTARTEWELQPPGGLVRRVLMAYAAGVNTVIRQDEASGTLPVMFKLLGYQPVPWTPVDSLVIQGIMTQTLDFTTAPVEYALLAGSLGYARTMAWFPVIPPNTQHPYDPGPYVKEPPAPIESFTVTENPAALTGGVPTNALPTGSTTLTVGLVTGPRSQKDAMPTPHASSAQRQALTTLVAFIRNLPVTAVHMGSNSNNWAVSGAKTANGGTMLAGDPHLSQTLPSIWFQVAATAPGYAFSGVSIPGVPGIVIGMNRTIAWSLTNVQNQATFFYQEYTSPRHPNQYYWRGAWRPMRIVRYMIPVKGHNPVPLTVRLTVHGPMMTVAGKTFAVDWMGALPSDDLGALLGVLQAANFQEFRRALSRWYAPSQNFAYADRHGNIGLISAGYYPLVAHGNPWMPLNGTGADDIVGTIPYNAIPQVYNPRTNFVFSANQREVAAN